ncbi:unnamed protein product [Protopolystoma xenopodis]|uniref:Uncharacterized protein n=1 Tax=Protopolystoma xenopodis TaxID=117903 RepID=A0A3S5AT66_9PLAT|nr:unnamed protein product [Protopolystoma xenopodis]
MPRHQASPISPVLVSESEIQSEHSPTVLPFSPLRFLDPPRIPAPFGNAETRMNSCVQMATTVDDLPAFTSPCNDIGYTDGSLDTTLCISTYWARQMMHSYTVCVPHESVWSLLVHVLVSIIGAGWTVELADSDEPEGKENMTSKDEGDLVFNFDDHSRIRLLPPLT